MGSFYVLRHAPTVANRDGIIQGICVDAELTPEGRTSIRDYTLSTPQIFKGIERIVCGPSKRTRQTAEIVSDIYGIPIVVDFSLNEFDSGVLAGREKSDVANEAPHLLDIWHRRGDLDGIPGAEKGDNLQARALFFLERYMTPQQLELVVTHAGFMRSMINTATGRRRSLPIDVNHNRLHEIDASWQNIPMTSLPAINAKVYLVTTADQRYVLKKIPHYREEDLKFEEAVSKHVSRQTNLLSEILYSGMKADKGVQILRYIEGGHIQGSLDPDQTNSVLVAAFELGKALSSFPFQQLHEPLDIKLRSCLETTSQSTFTEIGNGLLENEEFRRIIGDSPVLVHYDLHRENLIFTPEGDVKIIDMGSMMYAPEDFLAASLFLGTFLLRDPEGFNLESLLNVWPRELAPSRILKLMQARALIGATFFEKKIKNPSPTQEERKLFERYLDSLNYLKAKINL
jgi:broad specificity phosphatase PhoE